MKTYPTKGFTLLELALIVAIAVILAIVSIPIYRNLEKASHLAVEKEVVANINIGLSWYYIRHLSYPQSLDEATTGIGTNDSNFFNRVLIASDKISASWNKLSAVEYTNIWSSNKYCYSMKKGIFDLCSNYPPDAIVVSFDLPDTTFGSLADIQAEFPLIQYADYSEGSNRYYNIALENEKLVIGTTAESTEKLWLKSTTPDGDFGSGTYQFNDFSFATPDSYSYVYFNLQNGDLDPSIGYNNPFSDERNTRDGMSGYAIRASSDPSKPWVVEKYSNFVGSDQGGYEVLGEVVPYTAENSNFFTENRDYDISIDTQLTTDNTEQITITITDKMTGQTIEQTYIDETDIYSSGTLGYSTTTPKTGESRSNTVIKVGGVDFIPSS